MHFRYPWDYEIEDDVGPDRARQQHDKERTVEQSWTSVSWTPLEEIGKYGLEYWIYFQALKTSCVLLFVVTLLSLPKLFFVLRGTVLQQRDPFAWLARLSFGNVDASTRLELGALSLGLGSTTSAGFARGALTLGVFEALQLTAAPLFLLWFRLRLVPYLSSSPELPAEPSAADYALQIDGLPARLPDRQRHGRLDVDLASHFEQVLRDCPSAASSQSGGGLVCEATVVRDFRGSLLTFQEQERLDAAVAWAAGSTKRTQQLREQAAAQRRLAQQAQKEEEADRPIRRAFVILGSEEERDWLLSAYRFARIPLLGRLLQPSRLRLDGRWPLVLSPAPEPGDIVWAHLADGRRCSGPVAKPARLLARCFSALVLLFMFLLGSGLSLLVWWLSLGLRGAAAAQCSPWGAPSWASACLSPPSVDQLLPVGSAWEPGCDCFCSADRGESAVFGALGASARRSSASLCEGGPQALEVTLAVCGCALVAELLHHFQTRFLPLTLPRWRALLASGTERDALAVLALASGSAPMTATLGLLGFKLLLSGNADHPGLGAALTWEADRGWYLHAAPVVGLWCFLRWMAPGARAIAMMCRASLRGQRFILWERYASLAALMGICLAMQPLIPYLAPLGAVGLFVQYWSEKYIFLRGQVIVRLVAWRRFGPCG
ncbi:unnamed protein product, partial [Polarella glacialis]